jgi:chromosomal replication initiation ATPase DnaA
LGEGHREDFHRGSFEGRALGDARFVEQALKKSEEIMAVDLNLSQVIESICSAYCSAYQLSVTELCAPGKTQPAAEARAVAAFLVRNGSLITLGELAEFFKRDLSGLSQAALRIERRIEMDEGLGEKLERVSEMLRISVSQA